MNDAFGSIAPVIAFLGLSKCDIATMSELGLGTELSGGDHEGPLWAGCFLVQSPNKNGDVGVKADHHNIRRQ